jgi:hypothetical protein
LSAFPLPFVPSITDVREWDVEIDPAGTVLSKPLPASGKLNVSLHRVLIETGIAMSLATSSWDPRSWFALFRYGGDFLGTAPKLRFYSGVREKDSRLAAVASEEVATGITCYLLREHFRLTHIADVYACIQRGELSFVRPNDESRPDYFCEDPSGETVLAESKGSTGTRSSITRRIDPEGWEQVQNVVPTNLPLRNGCSRVVIGTHLCVEGSHGRSETTTIIKDPDGDISKERNPESDEIVRLAYAKAFRFMGHDSAGDFLVNRRRMESLFPFSVADDLPRIGEMSFLPMSFTPFGDAIGFYGPVGKALLSAGSESIKPKIATALDRISQLEKQSALLSPEVGYVLPNGVMIIHNPEVIV